MIAVRPAGGPGHSEFEVRAAQIDDLLTRDFDPRSDGADKGYHTRGFVAGMMKREIAPHVARSRGRRTPSLDGSHARSGAYRASQILRRRIEGIFGWMEAAGHCRRTRWKGVEKTHFVAQFMAATDNLIRMAKLGTAPPDTAAA